MSATEAVRQHMRAIGRKGAAAHAAHRNATLSASERAAMLGERALVAAACRARPTDIAHHLVITNTWGKATTSNVSRSLRNARRKLERQPLLAADLDSDQLRGMRARLTIQRNGSHACTCI